jgi:hypothetical protein
MELINCRYDEALIVRLNRYSHFTLKVRISEEEKTQGLKILTNDSLEAGLVDFGDLQ